MSLVRETDLNRFKKTTQGLIEFASLLEQASKKQRERIIKETQLADAPFLRRALKKVVYFEELPYLEETVLAQILAEVPARVLACAIRRTSQEFKTQIFRHMEYRQMKATLDEEGALLGDISEVFTEGAQIRILKIARELEAKGLFILELFECPRLGLKSGRRRRNSPL